ncbi:hypothetical protein K435DRAFT_961652 [Dendrothele bispora CBS 962.96]|uniref:Uncharacterized protein n=1 Tax=Dendrothele bispora (strain CBS 962.96) TaxID=1314807 RepID=A0A4S8MRF3_DENBC|nr:hypothetical protein K435DRAFT_961652 [Dendrothele bispora CBS 962.96]
MGLLATLTPVSISIVLEYISPPSQILQNPPPHLFSQSLLQRHHFLDIHPDDPVQYLSWPSPDQQQAFSLFESFSLDQKHSDSQFRIRYTTDRESFFAHVELGSSGVRLVFQWDSRDESWKYHNVTLMPFPLPSYESVTDVQRGLASESPHESNQALTDEDAYWNAYGQDDDYKPDADTVLPSQTDAQAEDAYWAQYASVQGTADSTIPSPLIDAKQKTLTQVGFYESEWPETTSRHSPNGDTDQRQHSASSHPDSQTENILDIPYSSLNIDPSTTHQFDPHSPPSPRELRDRLSVLSPLHGEATPAEQANGIVKSIDPTATTKDAIRGIYSLWKLSSRVGMSSDEGREEFLKLVQEAIE